MRIAGPLIMQPSAVKQLVPFLLAVVVAGCAAARAPVPATTAAVPPEDAPARPDTPSTAASAPRPVPQPAGGDLLYNLLLADIAAQRGDHKTAVTYYTAAARETRDARLAQRAARAALFAQDLEAAIPAAETWRELAPADPDPYQLLAVLHLQQGHLDAARENLRQLLSRGDFSSSADYINLARLFNRDGARESLLAMMDEVLAARPDDPEAMYAYVVVALRLEALEKAGAIAERLLAARPDWPDGALASAQVRELRGEGQGAADDLARFLVRHPDARDVRLARARLLVELKDYGAAREEFAQLARARPDDADALLALALVDMQLQDNAAARAHLRALTALPGQAERGHFYMGRLAESERDFTGAIAAYAKVRIGEHRLDAVVRQAELLGEQGELEAAQALLHGESTEDQPTHIRLLLTETNLLLDAGKPARAEQTVNAGLAQYPDDIDLLFARSLVLDKLNRLSAMEADLRRILAIDPDNAHALNAWGYTLAERGLRLEEAHTLISRALTLAPENPYILDSMGWVLHRMGRSEEGLTYLRRSLEALPDPEVYAHLGEVLRALGRTDEARATIAKGLETSPDDSRLLGVQRQLVP